MRKIGTVEADRQLYIVYLNDKNEVLIREDGMQGKPKPLYINPHGIPVCAIGQSKTLLERVERIILRNNYIDKPKDSRLIDKTYNADFMVKKGYLKWNG